MKHSSSTFRCSVTAARYACVADRVVSRLQQLRDSDATDARLLRAALTAAHPPSIEADSQYPADAAVRLGNLRLAGSKTACAPPGASTMSHQEACWRRSHPARFSPKYRPGRAPASTCGRPAGWYAIMRSSRRAPSTPSSPPRSCQSTSARPWTISVSATRRSRRGPTRGVPRRVARDVGGAAARRPPVREIQGAGPAAGRRQ